jgi:soluble lytic murein transglycosylase-like protein
MAALLCLSAGAAICSDAKSAGQNSIQRQLAAVKKQLAAVEKQREAIRLQYEKQLAQSDLPTQDPFQVDCDPLDGATIKALVSKASTKTVSAELLQAVIRQESAGKPCAVSHKGALGLMQLMPETAQELGLTDPFEPEQNVAAGARYLEDLLARYNQKLDLALAAYNAGPARVEVGGSIPAIEETQTYVRNVLNSLKATSAEQTSSEVPADRPGVQ